MHIQGFEWDREDDPEGNIAHIVRDMALCPKSSRKPSSSDRSPHVP
jgi:hypothetical protein